DEPTIGLDVVTQKKLRDFIKEYNQKYNATIILTSHYMGDIEELCERVIIIDKGELGYDGQLDELVKSYAPNKVIKLIFLKKIKEDDVKKYGRIISFDPLEVILEVPRNATKEIASRVLRELPVDDLDIAEVPIEDIIRQVFEKNKA
ncbi:MAG: ABC transporter, partial [Patescibacteria group bacterium]